jgi:hypothetical protein
MSHFARIENGIVAQVIVAEQDFIDSGAVGDPAVWIQTSYNTYAGEHKLGGTPLRKNYAGIGFSYDANQDAFIPPRPQNGTWILNDTTAQWTRPVPYPQDNHYYIWDESIQNWVESNNENIGT